MTTGMKMPLLFWIQSMISVPALAPWQTPLEHLPPPVHDVPSRKFWFIVTQAPLPMLGTLQEIMQSELPLLHEVTEVELVRDPQAVLHCWSREVHCPEAQVRPSPELPQESPSALCSSLGHVDDEPLQVS